MASLSASMRSSVVALSTAAALEGPWSAAAAAAALLLVRRFCSLGRGAPPSLAWTVRSWRRRRSRRTKVERHLRHLKGRSLVSAVELS
jgi:hypothetical protein